MTTPNPTPTPLASTAMEAATPRTDEAISQGYRFTEADGVREYVPAQFARQLERELAHFQPLLAKVEGEISTLRTERDVAIDKLLATLAALRADLAAKEAALRTIRSKCSEVPLPFELSVVAICDSALASRADKGGAT